MSRLDRHESFVENRTFLMSYKDFQRDRWNSLAREFGEVDALRAVISRNNDQANYYFDKTTKRILRRTLRFQHKKILDFGCGVGRLSVSMARKAEHVTGIDISDEMIRVARDAAVSQRVGNAVFQVYDGTKLPYRDASFDVIVCVAVLKYLIEEDDFAGVIGEMCRAVVPGGHVAVIDEFEYAGPVELGEEDIGGRSLLRHPEDYISRFQRNGMELVEQCSMFQMRFQRLGYTLPLGRRIAPRPQIARALAMVDVWADEALRHRVKPIRGFQLLSFVRNL
jgi:ubiquinone/menaquinone biosynthesis C-methylase UbiE